MGNTLPLPASNEEFLSSALSDKEAVDMMRTLNSSTMLSICNNKVSDRSIERITNYLLEHGKDIEIIDVTSNRITSNGAIHLFDRIAANHEILNIRELIFSFNELDDNCIDSFGKLISANGKINQVILRANKITDKGIQALLPYMQSNRTLTSLCLDKNKSITNESVAALVRIIQESRLQHLGVNETSITDPAYFGPYLIINLIKSARKKLELRKKGITLEHMAEISNVIQFYGSQIESINMNLNQITSKGAILLFDALGNNNVIKSIKLCETGIDDTCIESLCQLIFKAGSIVEIDLGGNSISDHGLKILSEGIVGNVSLQIMTLSNNPNITENAIPDIGQIAKNTYVKNISFYATAIKDSSLAETNKLFAIPLDARIIPVFSNAKSAAKSDALI